MIDTVIDKIDRRNIDDQCMLNRRTSLSQCTDLAANHIVIMGLPHNLLGYGRHTNHTFVLAGIYRGAVHEDQMLEISKRRTLRSGHVGFPTLIRSLNRARSVGSYRDRSLNLKPRQLLLIWGGTRWRKKCGAFWGTETDVYPRSKDVGEVLE
jgi:hypothetical protein